MLRREITVHGVVQGVGFRPFVYGVAVRLGLTGFVKNRQGAVLIEAQGYGDSMDLFLSELQAKPPTLSRIDRVESRDLPPVEEQGFGIAQSDTDAHGQIFISPDVATCGECLAELFDPTDRRYRYPFLNCTNCGPRLTIIEGAPYDRQRTTMARFAMCPACRREYDDPLDRRFHAQPTACPECGPHVTALDANGERISTNDPLAFFVDLVLQGKIGALKGLGGFHLVCDAGNEQAVSALRRRKARDEKPLAVMVADVPAARRLCEVSEQEQTLLRSPRRPIVLLRRREPIEGESVAGAVAPGNPSLGVMLPYTPLHHLLLQAVGDRPLVMTSGNRSDEPIAYQNDEAVERLREIADGFLTHDRPVRVRCDDSVTRWVGHELVIRRSRGYAPAPIKLPRECETPTLAVGGQLKGVFALCEGSQAFLSHHLGDLDHYDAYCAFERDIRLYEELFDIRPQRIVHDLHPDYASTTYAKRRATEEGLELFAVQHHHAHLASCMAENGLNEPVVGVSFDGTGYGADGAIWGGEFLVGDYSQCQRASHLRYVATPGGDKAIREPWRMAASHLLDAGCDLAPLARRVGAAEIRVVEQMIQGGFNSPLTSSAGRLFDAVAAIAGMHLRVSFEGQAAMNLEWLATEVDEDGVYPFELNDDIDTRPLIRAVAEDAGRGVAARLIARRFHSTVVEMIVAVCRRIRTQTAIDAAALSGGVFLNALLSREAGDRLQAEGFRVYRHRLVPPGDGGLSLGQMAVAAKAGAADKTVNDFDGLPES